jgi:hypothetical protein
MLKKNPPERKLKRILWDIEVSHNVVLAFRAGYEQTINPESIVSERKIICIGYKVEGEKKIHVLRWDKNQDDGEMLRDFMLVANSADELIAHHGDKYDLPFFRTRCLANGLEPIPNYKTVDTCAWAKRHYCFNSNKLDYISKFLGGKGKTKTDYELWRDVLLHNCPKALDRMCAYCADDVRELEFVYHKLKFCVKPKSHAGVFAGKDKWTCPRTGSTDVVKSKTRVTANGTIQHQMRNKADGSYFQISDSAYKQYQEYLKDLAAKSK